MGPLALTSLPADPLGAVLAVLQTKVMLELSALSEPDLEPHNNVCVISRYVLVLK